MKGIVALVTGSTSGIGLAIANHLAGKGCSIILHGSPRQGVVSSVPEDFKKYPGRVDFVPANFFDPASVSAFCEKVSQLYPDGVDILVNNAGIQHVCPIDEYPLEKWNDMMAVSLTAPFLLIKHFLPFMKQKGWGRIINMSSQMAMISAPGKAPYSAVKAGLVGLTKGVALESAQFGVTCNAICPGFVDVGMALRQLADFSKSEGISLEEAKKHYSDRFPTKKFVTTEEICGLVDFLCTSSAKNITASAMLIDAGAVAQ